MKFWKFNESTKTPQDFDFATFIEKNVNSESKLNYITDISYNINYWSYYFFSQLDKAPRYIADTLDLSLESHTLESLSIAIKFLMLVALLIFIRGGIPRYRFDHLTKMGWIKYLSLVLASLLVQLLLIYSV